MTGTDRSSRDESSKVVPFGERARGLGRSPTDEDACRREVDPTDLARESMFRRLAELADELDPVPQRVADDAKASYRWRSIDDELARLTYDSALDPDLLIGVRGGGGAVRQLTFEAPQLVLEVEITHGEPRSLTCQVVPPQSAQLEIRYRGGTVSVGRDGYGTFHLPALPAGPVSIRCIPTDVRVGPAATSWVTL